MPSFFMRASSVVGLAEQARGAFRTTDSPSPLFEHGDDVVSLHVIQASHTGFARGRFAGRPVGQLEGRTLGDDERALDHIAQLPNVAGPVVGHEQVERAFRDRLYPLAELNAVLQSEVSHE